MFLSTWQWITLVFALLVVLPIVTRKPERPRKTFAGYEDLERAPDALPTPQERETALIKAAGLTP